MIGFVPYFNAGTTLQDASFCFCLHSDPTHLLAYLLLGDLERLQVVTDHPELLFQLHDLGFAGLCTLLGSLEVGLNHGQLASNLDEKDWLEAFLRTDYNVNVAEETWQISDSGASTSKKG